MKMPFIILCQCLDWQPLLDAIPCLCWGIIGLIALYLILKFVVVPWMVNCHENRMKEDAHKREIEWNNRHLTKEMVEKLHISPDEWLKNQMDKLTEDIMVITKELESKKDKEEKVIESLKIRKKAYEEMLNHISTIVSIEDKKESEKKINNQKQEKE